MRFRGFFGESHSGWILVGLAVCLLAIAIAFIASSQETVMVAMVLCIAGSIGLIVDGVLVARSSRED